MKINNTQKQNTRKYNTRVTVEWGYILSVMRNEIFEKSFEITEHIFDYNNAIDHMYPEWVKYSRYRAIKETEQLIQIINKTNELRKFLGYGRIKFNDDKIKRIMEYYERHKNEVKEEDCKSPERLQEKPNKRNSK